MDNYPPSIIPYLKTVPYAHQLEGLRRSWNLPYYALLMEMGTGKSKIVVDTIAALWMEKRITGALILAPKGVYLNWVKNEIPTHMSDEVSYYMEPWTTKTSYENLTRMERVMEPEEGSLDIFVMNIEALNTERGMDTALRFLNKHTTITIIDESTCIKSYKADRTKRCYTLAKYSKYRRIMTGTPITQSPLDLFSQFQFLCPGVLGFTSFTAFRSYYAEMVTMNFGNRSFPKITGFRNIDQLQRKIAPISYRKLKSECLDLPDKVYECIYVEMTPAQQKIYDKLKEEALVQWAGDRTLSTTSVLTTIMRLQQIVCGHVKLDDGGTVPIENNRMTALDDLLESIPGKVIIWCNFQHDVKEIELNLAEDYGQESVVTYYGPTTEDQRADALTRFKSDAGCRFFVGTPSTGGRGLTLIEASTTIYYSNGYNLEHRLQSEDRNHRIGQKNTVTVIDIICLKSVDERIVQLLKAKKNLADMVLDNPKQFLLDDVSY